MNPGALVVSSVLFSAAVAFGIAYSMQPEPSLDPNVEANVTTGDLEALRAEIRALREERRAVVEPARVDVADDLDARIERALARALADRDRASDAGDADGFNVDAVVVELLEQGSVNPNVASATWQRIKDAGKIDAVIAAFERRAAENPDSADAQADLGEAYVAKIMEATTTMEQGASAMAADQAYDKALELDPTHWRARFNKAISYSFWPPITGKPAEAVDHFQTLMSQQEANPGADNGAYAQTYLMLGNLYSQRGETEKAKQVWARGARHHPGSTELSDKAK